MPDLSGDGTLADGVLNLAQTLTKNNAILRERTEEKARLTKINAEFRKHLSWQSQRTQTLKRNLERLHNETKWLATKSDEVRQDAQVVAHELRQATAEVRPPRWTIHPRRRPPCTHPQPTALPTARSLISSRRRARLAPSSCGRSSRR